MAYNNLVNQDIALVGKIEQNQFVQLIWDESPTIEANILISDLPKINFKISILKNLGTVEKPQNIIRGEAFFFVQKLVTQSSRTFQENELIIKEQKQSKEIFLNGKKEGEVTVILEARHHHFFMQKVAGVQTENGLIYQSPIIYPRKEKQHPKIIQLLNLYDDLQKKILAGEIIQDHIQLK